MTLLESDVVARRQEVAVWYGGHRYKCELFQQAFTVDLRKLVRQRGPHGASVESRTKSVESVVEKASKTAAGTFKYQDPAREITDLVGARVIVPLISDIETVRRAIIDRYEVEEESDRGDEATDGDVPGYRSLHLLVRPGNAELELSNRADFADVTVEIQVRTILQHAWAALQHDLGYKPEHPPTPAVRRRVTALAGLLELADREFVQVKGQQLRGEDEPVPVPVREVAASDARLTTASLRVYVESLLGAEDDAAHAWYVNLGGVIAGLGLASTEDLTGYLTGVQEHAAVIVRRMRRDKPWANGALVFDLLLRVADPDRYLHSACQLAGWEQTDVEAGFERELSPYLELLT